MTPAPKSSTNLSRLCWSKCSKDLMICLRTSSPESMKWVIISLFRKKNWWYWEVLGGNYEWPWIGGWKSRKKRQMSLADYHFIHYAINNYHFLNIWAYMSINRDQTLLLGVIAQYIASIPKTKNKVMNNFSPLPSFASGFAPDSSIFVSPIFWLSVFFISEGVSSFDTGLNLVLTDGTKPFDPFEAIDAAFYDFSLWTGLSTGFYSGTASG